MKNLDALETYTWTLGGRRFKAVGRVTDCEVLRHALAPHGLMQLTIVLSEDVDVADAEASTEQQPADV